jgi:lysyl-tRNA synthetase class II
LSWASSGIVAKFIVIDRLRMMLLGQESIRDVILFPQMKPK